MFGDFDYFPQFLIQVAINIFQFNLVTAAVCKFKEQFHQHLSRQISRYIFTLVLGLYFINSDAAVTGKIKENIRATE